MIHVPFKTKPVFGGPCNGCGLCCALSLCGIAKLIDPTAQAPCRYLEYQKERAVCQLVEAEKAFNLPPKIQKALGIGNGCSMEDDDYIEV